MKKININLINTEQVDNWGYVVNTSTSLMSLSWIDHYFVTLKEARDFTNLAHKQGYVALVCSREDY